MNKLIKRFRIFNSNAQTRVFEADTTQQVYDFLKDIDKELTVDLFIDCVVDDTEATADEFIEAWEAGERPGDLQMF